MSTAFPNMMASPAHSLSSTERSMGPGDNLTSSPWDSRIVPRTPSIPKTGELSSDQSVPKTPDGCQQMALPPGTTPAYRAPDFATPSPASTPRLHRTHTPHHCSWSEEAQTASTGVLDQCVPSTPNSAAWTTRNERYNHNDDERQETSLLDDSPRLPWQPSFTAEVTQYARDTNVVNAMQSSRPFLRTSNLNDPTSDEPNSSSRSARSRRRLLLNSVFTTGSPDITRSNLLVTESPPLLDISMSEYYRGTGGCTSHCDEIAGSEQAKEEESLSDNRLSSTTSSVGGGHCHNDPGLQTTSTSTKNDHEVASTRSSPVNDRTVSNFETDCHTYDIANGSKRKLRSPQHQGPAGTSRASARDVRTPAKSVSLTESNVAGKAHSNRYDDEKRMEIERRIQNIRNGQQQAVGGVELSRDGQCDVIFLFENDDIFG